MSTNIFRIRSASQLFETTEEESLISLGDGHSLIQFTIGDLTLRAIDRLKKAKARDPELTVSVMDVYKHVSALTSCSMRSVEEYTATAAFYAPDDRERLKPLRFSHLSFAKRYPYWREIVEAALDYLERNGKLPSVEFLSYLFAGRAVEDGLEAAEQTPAVDDAPPAVDLPDPVFSEFDDQPKTTPKAAFGLVVVFERSLDLILRRLVDLPLNPLTKNAIQEGVRGTLEGLQLARAELDEKTKRPH